MSKNSQMWIGRALIVVLALVLTGVPQLAQAQSTATQPSAGTAADPQQTQPRPGMVDPSQGPLQPVAPSEPLPNAPSAANPQEPTTATPSARTSAEPQRPAEAPAGAAVGQQGATAGGAASKPAGNAIAPAKQRQVRSLLIKLGLIGAAGVAIGTVVGLSKASPSKPPNAR
jgi:hypothetical protein